MTVQVGSLMWMRTVMNYQYRHGSSTSAALSSLWREGGLRRLYRGLGPALLQGPLARFGDTAANEAALHYFQDSSLPLAAQTGVASLTSALWRVAIMPVDALKTTLQAEGARGTGLLVAKVQAGGAGVLWHGALAAASATAAGHFPWFLTYNLLQDRLPEYAETHKELAKDAAIGFTASVVSDTITNSLRVGKVIRQTYHEPISYRRSFEMVIRSEGVLGLLGRGLRTRILVNGVQGLMFSVLWQLIKDRHHGAR
jgi:hypothetical protein